MKNRRHPRLFSNYSNKIRKVSSAGNGTLGEHVNDSEVNISDESSRISGQFVRTRGSRVSPGEERTREVVLTRPNYRKNETAGKMYMRLL